MRNKLCLCACAFIISIQQSEFGYYGRTFYGPDRVHGRVSSAYACTRPRTQPCTGLRHGRVGLHSGMYPWTQSVHGRVTGPCARPCTRVTRSCTRPCTRRAHDPWTRPWSLHCRVHAAVFSRVHDPYLALYRPCTCMRPVYTAVGLDTVLVHRRVHGLYTAVDGGPCPRCKGRVHGRVHDYLYTSQFHGRVRTLSTAV